MELAYGSDHDAAAQMAAKALEHCAAPERDRWKTGTIAEARLILGETAVATTLYRDAINQLHSPREVESMLQQGIRLADLLGEEEAVAQLGALYRGDETEAAEAVQG